MATFKNQVQGLTQISIGASSAPTEDELSQFLQDGTKDIINKLVVIKPAEAFKFGTESTVDTNAGITINGQVLSVVRENGNTADLRNATPIAANLRYLATDQNSLHYRSAYNPAFYLLNRKLYVLPDPSGSNNSAIVSHVNYPSPTHNDSISGIAFPAEYENLIILYAAAMSSMAAASDIQNNMPTKPTALLAPTFQVEGVSLPTPPDYVGPTLDFNISRTTAKLIEEDLEAADKEMDKLEKLLNKFGKEGDDAQKVLTKDIEVFKANLDRVTKNADRQVQINATEYRSVLYRFQHETAQYTAEVQEEMAQYKWFIEQYMALMNQYNSQLSMMIGPQQAPEEEPKKERRR